MHFIVKKITNKNESNKNEQAKNIKPPITKLTRSQLTLTRLVLGKEEKKMKNNVFLNRKEPKYPFILWWEKNKQEKVLFMFFEQYEVLLFNGQGYFGVD